MGKFNKAGTRTAVASAITSTSQTPTGVTFQGGPGFSRDAKSELFLLAVTNFVGENTFYEAANERDARFTKLVRTVAVADPEWMLKFVGWLRSEGNMRTASVLMGVEAAKALLDSGYQKEPGHADGMGLTRQLVSAGMARADEPGEALAYWLKVYGRKLPKPIKRGLADAVVRLYNQWAFLKYDSSGNAVRFADLLNLTHPEPVLGQDVLFKFILDRTKQGTDVQPDLETLPMLAAHYGLRRQVLISSDPGAWKALVDTQKLREAGMTWEDVLSIAGNHADKKALWEALIPNMGYMALLRNLRNFDEAGVSDEVAALVTQKLANPDEVKRSRQLPLRFLSAYRNAPSLRWSYALDMALRACLANVPALGGRTLILVDTSGSMHNPLSARSDLLRWDAAVVFGLALAARCANADVVSFSDRTIRFPKVAGESLLKGIDRWERGGFFIGSGTDTVGAVRAHFAQHDRVVILTDEQLMNWGGQSMAEHVSKQLDQVVPQNTWLHTFNLAGYEKGHTPSGLGTRHTYGGLTDSFFKVLPMIEKGIGGVWPWEVQNQS